VAEVARLAFDHGGITLCTFISPFAADREFARSLLPQGRFVEIYVKCDLEVVKRRDPKGLYARAMRGEIPEFTGVSSPYEEPRQAELVVETDVQSAEEIVDRIWEFLVREGFVSTT
jgi:adenylylsulfate kinase-like enzyme